MKLEDQKVAMAKACGWVLKELNVCHPAGLNNERVWLWFFGTGPLTTGHEEPPDFINDWNAIHDAVNRLPVELRLRFVNALGDITLARSDEWIPARIATATKDEWREALLRTIGKWTEETL